MLLPLLAAFAPFLSAADDVDARSRAAGALESALARVETSDMAPVTALATLRAAGAVAVRDLGEQRVATLIEGALLDARWRATVEPASAASELEGALRSLASDLRFEPILEAEQPPGFPAPTPVHEIRLTEYPGYRLAYADMEGPRDGGAFFKLFRHIQSNEIAMTAPVEVTFDASRMEQTRMAFLYEGPTQGELGSDGPVEVVDVAPMLVASVGCRGNDRSGRITDMHDLLVEWVAAQPELEVAGELRTMGFNSPMVRGDRRFFEVQLPVRRVEREAPAPVVRRL